MDLLVSTRAPTVIFSDDFEAIVGFWEETQNTNSREAVRIATQAVCSINLIADTYILAVKRAALGRKLHDTIGNFCEFYGIEDPRSVAAAVIKHASMNPQSTFADFISQQQLVPTTQRKPENIRLDELGFSFEFMADQYAKIGLYKPNPAIFWPTALFLDAARPGEKIKGPIDLLGPSRFLVHGPYMHLPAGDWRVVVVIEVSENTSRNKLLVDVASQCVLAGVIGPLPESGLFELEMQFRIDDPFHPVEVRFQIMEGAIEGRLWLRQVVFHPVQNAA
ncbi:MAG: hypothetical protein FWC84_06940 [Alphaproteobacteria bacterium]|nr:hypothetical protein [Alphaproteobacteria bacterium]